MNRKTMAEAVALHQQGRHEEAKQKYQKLALQFPRDPDLLHFRGLLASHMGDQAEALRLIGEAIAQKPETPEFHQNLAISHQLVGDAVQASVSYNNQGVLLQKFRRVPEAVEAFEKSLMQDPDNYWAASNYAAALNELGEYDRSLDILRRVEKKVKTAQERSFVLSNIGNCYYYLGKSAKAMDCFRQAIELYPENAEAHRNRAVMLLADGKLKEGFADFEWRCINGVMFTEKQRAFTQPVWHGESPEALGGAILVIAEQGFGDMIHFSRYVKMLAAQGHRVIFEVQPELYNLFSEGWADESRIRITRRQPNGKVFNDLPFVAFVSVMSLANRFGTTLATVPADIPYIDIDQKRLAQWDRIVPADNLLKIGLVWKGSASTPHDHLRSMPAHFLEPLLARDDVRFYSLQKGEAANYKFQSTNIVNLDARLRDFADTAAAIRHLDLVISIDSAVAHLAGAVGGAVWLPMPQVLDWRWLRERADSPWYPNTRLFRQKKPADWESTVSDMNRALDKLLAKRRAA